MISFYNKKRISTSFLSEEPVASARSKKISYSSKWWSKKSINHTFQKLQVTKNRSSSTSYWFLDLGFFNNLSNCANKGIKGYFAKMFSAEIKGDPPSW